MGGRAPGLLGRPVLTQGSLVSCPRAARTHAPLGCSLGKALPAFVQTWGWLRKP